jgi:hypothetical protein
MMHQALVFVKKCDEKNNTSVNQTRLSFIRNFKLGNKRYQTTITKEVFLNNISSAFLFAIVS